jgi:Protein of unknown function (DUF1501)/Protein of unknown function (DUF1549)/Protein of unknown function (DUF1553)/Planctomycete cytochrome C
LRPATRSIRLIENIRSPHASRAVQRKRFDLLNVLNAEHREGRLDARLDSRIQSFEMAFRMQIEAADAFDIAREPRATRDLYGPGVHGRQTLIARRLLERGVRYVQLWHGAGQPWDDHAQIEKNHRRLAGELDQSIAALLTDLKLRGMLEETLVIWGGEFGRTPTVELNGDGKSQLGRDHDHYGFSVWMAGGGIKGGTVHGATDDFGFKAVQDQVSVHDLHATILHLLGFDHERLNDRYAGRDFRLTDVHGKVIKDILARSAHPRPDPAIGPTGLLPGRHSTRIEPRRTIRAEVTMKILRMLPVALLAMPGLPSRAEEPTTFERQVRPILKAYCLDCHGGGTKLEGKLDLRLKRTAASGGKSGPALVSGKPDESLLLQRIREREMPPGEKKVPPEQVALIERWIASGASTAREEPASLPPGIGITPEDRAFWAFQPVRRPEPPPSRPEDRVRTPIDAFLLTRLRQRGLALAAEADRATLIRRAAADLTGLPPTRSELEAFVADRSPDAYERMVDRLLDSPAYGERWGRHWLDVAGYADSDGNGSDDRSRPHAYKYRDYVVRSFNADKPLDRFLVEQLAGDELVPRPWSNLTREQAETLAATGFLRMAADGTSAGGADEPIAANQVVADALKVVGSSMLGLTVGCAQCHDHKYDPISQVDYFRLRAVFEPALDPQHWRRPAQRLVSLYSDADRARAASIEAEAQELTKAIEAKAKERLAAAFEKQLAKFPEGQRSKLRAAYEAQPDRRTDEQKALLAANPSVNLSPGVLYQYDPAAAEELKKDRQRIASKRAEKPFEDFVSVLDEVPGVVPETHVFYRGDHRQPQESVGPGDLTIAAPEGDRFEVAAKDPGSPSTGRRLAYARHLVDGRHPLVGRVLANRFWLHHFGRGLVESPGDLGVLGGRPTHPELLDWLADELVRQGWSLKRMHRLIMTSTAYRQSSRRHPAADAVDADNTLIGRYPVRRLDAEAIRDRILAASGRLDRAAFGPPVGVAEDAVGQVLPAGDSTRRSLYLEVRRTRPVSLLAAFDLPVMAVNCDRRTPTTSAPQSLMLMNSDFVLGQSKAMAGRLIAETTADFAPDLTASRPGGASSADFHGPMGASLPQMIAYAWTLAYQRPISPGELDAACAFVAGHLAVPGGNGRELAALTHLCQQLLSSNEFLYVD